MTLADYLPVKQLMESEALALQEATPILVKGPRKGKRALHLADASTQVLQSEPSIWALYQHAIAAGLPSEFQRSKRPSTSSTPKEQAWRRIERLARAMVASSTSPITLRTAVMKVVAADPSLYHRYAVASRRVRRGVRRR